MTALGRLLGDAPEPARRALRELDLAIRALQRLSLRTPFRRASALIRELATKQHKRLHVTLHGEELELSRAAIAAVSDALVHLGRNAVDHGLEHEIERVAAAKPDVARISLTARTDGELLLIEILDDGRGMNRERLLSKAIERNLVELEKAHELRDEDVYALVFTPGFSTAERVTEISGCGVGLDAVKHAIEALGGRVTIASQLGVGTRVCLSLPADC